MTDIKLPGSSQSQCYLFAVGTDCDVSTYYNYCTTTTMVIILPVVLSSNLYCIHSFSIILRREGLARANKPSISLQSSKVISVATVTLLSIMEEIKNTVRFFYSIVRHGSYTISVNSRIALSRPFAVCHYH